MSLAVTKDDPRESGELENYLSTAQVIGLACLNDREGLIVELLPSLGVLSPMCRAWKKDEDVPSLVSLKQVNKSGESRNIEASDFTSGLAEPEWVIDHTPRPRQLPDGAPLVFRGYVLDAVPGSYQQVSLTVERRSSVHVGVTLDSVAADGTESRIGECGVGDRGVAHQLNMLSNEATALIWEAGRDGESSRPRVPAGIAALRGMGFSLGWERVAEMAIRALDGARARPARVSSGLIKPRVAAGGMGGSLAF